MRHLVFGVVFLVWVIPCGARIITVDDDGPADFNNIQAAINDANNGDIIEVNVGTYTGEGNRDIDFLGKAITVQSTNPNDVNVVAATIIDCNGTEEEHHRGFDFHSGEDQNSIVEGFTITNGFHGNGGGIRCDGSSPTIRRNVITGNETKYDGDGGGGIACWSGASPVIANNHISYNVCPPGGGGGGIRCYDACSPTITNNTIYGNTASQGGGMLINDSDATVVGCIFIGNSSTVQGGGMLSSGSCLILADCTFSANSASRGAGTYNSNSSSTLFKCRFISNSAEYTGGGIHDSRESNTTLTNCIFGRNRAGEYGGGIYFYGYVSTITAALTNCTFSGNMAHDGNGLACDSYLQDYPSEVYLTNCILWDGGNEIWNNDGSSITVTYSNLQGGWPGLGNIDVHPCFVKPGEWVDANDANTVVEPNDPNVVWLDGDYHLKSQGWQWDIVRQRWDYDDEVTSRCIDAGNPGSTLDEEPLNLPDKDPNNDWGINLRVNMGAYGGTAEASMAPHDRALLSDITNDGVADFSDFAHLADIYTGQDEELPADFDRDGDVDYGDLSSLVDDWLKQTSWYQ